MPRAPTCPNLVFVFPDQFRAQAMGFMGEDPVRTPVLDRFAAQSVVFTNAVGNQPLCSPYRAMLLTGRWPYSTGVVTNCNSSRPDVYLREHEVCLSDVLAQAGYATGYIGKWHLDTPQGVPVAPDWRCAIWEAYTPPGPRRHSFAFWHAYGCHNNHLHPYYWIGDAPESMKTQVDEYSPLHEARVAADYIRNRDGAQRDPARPFALCVSMNPPHLPYPAVPERYRALYRDRTPDQMLNRPNVRLASDGGREAVASVADYFAAVTAVDEAFGVILNALREAGLEDNTLVVFSSDHGDMMGSHGLMYKTVYYEESFRIPLLVRFPGRLTPRREPLHFNVPDTMPTLLDLMGLADRIPDAVEGTNYAPALRGEAQPRPTSTFYLRPDVTPALGMRGVRTDCHTFVIERTPSGQTPVLFDNQQDPGQLKNVAADQPAVVTALTQELDGWLRRTRDPWERG